MSEKLKMIVRVEKSGEHKDNIIGVFAEAQHFSHPSTCMLDMIDQREGWTHCDVDWYQNKTRPATAEEEATFCEWFEPRECECECECELVKRRIVKRS